MYVDSGGGTAANLYEADLYAFPLGSGLYSASNGVNTPSPKVVLSEDVDGADSHGVLRITEGGRNGVFEAIAPMSNIDADGVQRADGHALWVRNVR